jgi:hypothetical protein
MPEKFYDVLDTVFSSVTEILYDYTTSETLQEYFANCFLSIFYAYLINAFFMALTAENAKECGPSSGRVVKIKRKYEALQKHLDLALSEPLEGPLVDEQYYKDFKAKLITDFPEALNLISEVEREIDLEKGQQYLKEKTEALKNTGKSKEDFHSFVITTALEGYVKKNKCFPRDEDLSELMESITSNTLPEISELFVESMKTQREMLEEHRETLRGFDERLYQRWQEPLDLLESLIMVAMDAGQIQQKKLVESIDKTNDWKFSTLLQIHARACQITNEILALLKAGYADGAIARWRSLHELSVISDFLLNADNAVSKRYLDHRTAMTYRDAKDYRDYCETLGFAPIEDDEFKGIKNAKERLDACYGEGFSNDWGWIPKDIVPDQKFKALEKHIRLGHLRPFYNLSAAAVHGLSKGFYRLGLDESQNTLLCGPSDMGLTDPIQLASMSMNLVTVCLLSIQIDLESLLLMLVSQGLVEAILGKLEVVERDFQKDSPD